MNDEFRMTNFLALGLPIRHSSFVISLSLARPLQRLERDDGRARRALLAVGRTAGAAAAGGASLANEGSPAAKEQVQRRRGDETQRGDILPEHDDSRKVVGHWWRKSPDFRQSAFQFSRKARSASNDFLEILPRVSARF